MIKIVVKSMDSVVQSVLFLLAMRVLLGSENAVIKKVSERLY